jgi:glycosyltransferase involved in cell wall biosynthesis
MKQLVSVIVPTRNRARQLSQAIGSIFAQRRLHELFELEVVVVDDASADDTAEMVRRYPEVRYIRLARNGGPARARNEGIRSSTGNYVAFLDDDDVWLPHKLELQVPALEQYPEVGVVYSQYRGHFHKVDGVFPYADRAPSGWIFREMLLRNCCGADSSLLIRRTALDRVGYFDESLATNCDYDLWMRLAFHCPFLFLAGAVAEYTPTVEGLWFSSATKGTEADDHARVVEKGLALLPNWYEFATLRREARALAALNAASPFLLMGDFARAWLVLLKALCSYPSALSYDESRRTLMWALAVSFGDWILPLQRFRWKLGPAIGRALRKERNFRTKIASDPTPQTDRTREH